MKRLLSIGALSALMVMLSACNISLSNPSFRTPGTFIDDTLLARQVNAGVEKRILDVEGASVRVHVFNGIVLLLGYIATAEQKSDVESEVHDVLHVRGVVNELSVGNQRQVGEFITDTVLCNRVRAALINHKEIDFGQFNVICYRSTVYLMGTVSTQAATQATETTRYVSGVKQVIKTFEYID